MSVRLLVLASQVTSQTQTAGGQVSPSLCFLCRTPAELLTVVLRPVTSLLLGFSSEQLTVVRDPSSVAVL